MYINFYVCVLLDRCGYKAELNEYDLELCPNNELLKECPTKKEIEEALINNGVNMDDVISITIQCNAFDEFANTDHCFGCINI